MANSEHLDILKQGVAVWNQWRKDNPNVIPDLKGAEIQGANLPFLDLMEANFQRAVLCGAKLHRAELQEANFRGANLNGADFCKANLMLADLMEAKLSSADFRGAKLQGANLGLTDLRGVKFQEAELRGANLKQASLIGTVLDRADLSNCRIYGISAWDISLKKTKQSDLIITREGQSIITVDNLEVAQFIYLLLNNEKIRHVIDTITSKVVLILGRFTPERKAVLDAIREKLRKLDYLPVLFDFDKPDSQDFIETVSTLAHMAKFVIADFTDAKIVLEEVPHIVRNIAVPVKPILLKGSEKEPSPLYNLRRNHKSLLDTYWYKDKDDLLTSFQDKIIIPAEEKSKELRAITID